MQSHMLPSNLSHAHNHTGLKSKLGQEQHLAPFTPPQSSKSSFAQLPQASTQGGQSSRWNPQLVSQSNPFIRYDHLTNTRPAQCPDEDEFDDDLQTAAEEDDYDEFETDGGPIEPQFARLAARREPSPSGILVFSADGPEDFDVLDINQALQIEAALVTLTGPISSALTQYRNQFNQWELAANPPESVIHASIMIDQCLAKFVDTLEPLDWIVNDLFQLSYSLGQFTSFLSEIGRNDDRISNENNTLLWNGLGRLADKVALVEEALSERSSAISELCDWVDGLLTPALAVVKFPNANMNSLVSKILDVHSYLCESLVKACSILKVYLNCMQRIASSISRFQSIISNDNYEGEPHFPIHQASNWSSKWVASLSPIINSLGVFHAISECVQVHCEGHFSSSPSSAESASVHDPDCFIVYSKPPLPSFGIKPGFENVSFSHS